MAWNIGANDVANAMGTSVGSKALTLKKAVLLAALLEFSGAFFVGSSVSETIQHGIIAPEVFRLEPEVFVLGMLSALLATGLLLQVASYFGLPISTTHAIVGAVLGFGLVGGGAQAVYWGTLFSIVLSWILSPLLSGVISFLIFSWIRKTILEATSPLLAAKTYSPLLVFVCFHVLILSLCYKGLHVQIPFRMVGSFAFSGSLAAAGVCYIVFQKTPVLAYQKNTSTENGVEKIFVYLQILSACLVAFAHGANDVANAIGPVAAIWGVLQSGGLLMQGPAPLWLLGVGGLGIVMGLATWGWRVIETIGKKITELTPSRGFAAEFGAATTILIASKFGLPISTTHALVGALCGVGFARGSYSLNWNLLKEILLSWMVTIPLCMALSIVLFSVFKWMLVLLTP